MEANSKGPVGLTNDYQQRKGDIVKISRDFDSSEFWDTNVYSREYLGRPVDQKMIDDAQEILGYRLPKVYIELMKTKNGGTPKRTCIASSEATSWAPDHVALTGILGLDPRTPMSLCGNRGSQFWIDEWKYPPIGVYFADCPSAGHDMLCLDYRLCGSEGEPQIVHVDQEHDYRVTLLCGNFEEFIRSLRSEDDFR